MDFRRFNISTKILLGSLPLALFMIALSVYALFQLERLNDLNSEIIVGDVPVIEATEKMKDCLLAEEGYRRRYMILGSSDILQLFWKRSEEFRSHVSTIEALWDGKDPALGLISSSHQEYVNLFLEGLEYFGKAGMEELARDYSDDLKEKHDGLIAQVKNLATQLQRKQRDNLLQTSILGMNTFRTTALLCGLGILLGIGTSIVMTGNISRSIHRLKAATGMISDGRYDDVPELSTSDELGELSRSFAQMARRVKKSEELYLDASPLTRLPGNVAIENVLTKRIEAGARFAFCLADLDDFKAFNDCYGYAMGSEVIKATADVVLDAVTRHGTNSDFVGHIGGDDFVVVTEPENFEKICSEIIESFDRMIKNYYEPEDLERGCIEGKTRQGELMTFPVMSISIAVVSNIYRDISCHIEVGEIAAEMKELAKSRPGSNYVVDKRLRGRTPVAKDRTAAADKEGQEKNVIKFPRKESS